MQYYIANKNRIVKSLLFVLIIVASHYKLMAQGIDLQCNNLLGGNYKNESIMIDFSVGEQISIPTLFHNSSFIISSGFLQNKNSDISTYKTLDSFLLKLTMGPNPTNNYFTISIHQLGITVVQICILDMQGNILHQLQAPSSGLNFKKRIDMTMQKEGVYLIQIQFLIDGIFPKTRTYKIFKST